MAVAITKSEIQADMDVVKAYADKFGSDKIETYLCGFLKRSWFRRTYAEILEEQFGKLEERDHD